MPTQEQIFQTFTDLSANLLREVYMPGLYDISYLKKRSWFMNRIPRKSDGVDALAVKLGFRTGRGWSWRPMGEFGYTATGSPGSYAKQSFELGCHTASVNVTHKEIMATEGEASPIKNIMDDKMREIYETFPYYLRALLWSPESGILGVAASIAGLVVTLDNAGLWNTLSGDICKLFEPDMFVQVLRAGVKVGNPIKIVSVDRTANTITVSSDPGIADNDQFVLTDIAGLENGYNTSSPGIFDVIDNDNTFQGVNRALAANSKFRANVTTAGSSGAIIRATLANFFQQMYWPSEAFTNYKVIERYYTNSTNGIAANRDYTDMKIVDGYSTIQVQQTRLVEDDDCDADKIVVPDFGNMFVAEGPGGIQNLFGKGWQQIPGRPFMEYCVAYWMRLVAKDCRYMGVLNGLSLTA